MRSADALTAIYPAIPVVGGGPIDGEAEGAGDGAGDTNGGAGDPGGVEAPGDGVETGPGVLGPGSGTIGGGPPAPAGGTTEPGTLVAPAGIARPATRTPDDGSATSTPQRVAASCLRLARTNSIASVARARVIGACGPTSKPRRASVAT